MPRWHAAALSSLFLHAAVLYWMSVSSGIPLSLPHQERGSALQVRLGPAPLRVGAPVQESDAPPQRPVESRLRPPVPERSAHAGDAPAKATTPATPTDADKAPLFPIPDPGYLPARELDSRPTPLVPVILSLPDAPLDKPHATATLLLYIGSDGAVDRIEIEDSELPPAFERSVVETFRAARMRPGMKDGRNVRALMKIQVEYASQ